MQPKTENGRHGSGTKKDIRPVGIDGDERLFASPVAKEDAEFTAYLVHAANHTGFGKKLQDRTQKIVDHILGDFDFPASDPGPGSVLV